VADLQELIEAIRAFSADRNWQQFHDPKSFALALVGEVGEVAELLQWLPADSAAEQLRAGPMHERFAEELAYVFIYLINLADQAGIDLLDAGRSKFAAAAAKYPATDFRDRAPERA